MNNLWLALEGAWHVLLAGLALGAGLPAVFALGIRALAYGVGGAADVVEHKPHPVARVVAYFCFAIVISAILLGIGTIVAKGFGMSLTFDGIMPVFVHK